MYRLSNTGLGQRSPASGSGSSPRTTSDRYRQQPESPQQAPLSPGRPLYYSSSSQPPPPPPSSSSYTASHTSQQRYHYTGRPTGTAYQSSAPATVDDDEDTEDQTAYFEKNRIKLLQDERVYIQKKTFTKWCNSYLNKARLEIGDLFTDLNDGILLMKFLEIISGDKLGKPNRGQMRVQKVENLNTCLNYLKAKKIHIENIGAEDILDQNPRLILGLIWTIILRFTIENIEIEGQETGERKHARDALLLWCQRKTTGYPNVKVENFTTSWRSGLAFNALIHAHRPDIVSFNHLNPQDAIGNLNNAFDVAERQLEIPRLLDAEDVIKHPDDKSIITYVSLYYHYFAKQKTEMTGARRVAKVVGSLLEHDHLQNDYEQFSADLLRWIKKTVDWLNNRRFPNSLHEMQDQLTAFNNYRKTEKPPKYNDMGELQALFFDIQTKRQAMGRSTYTPPIGHYVHDVESAWANLEKAENDRQLALISEIQRQKKLEEKAQLFFRKAQVRESWLLEFFEVLNGIQFTDAPKDVEVSTKLLRNISTQAEPKGDRFRALSAMSSELQNENYHNADVVRQREKEIIERWCAFLALLKQKEAALGGLKSYSDLIRDIETLSSELRTLESSMKTRDTGKHILAVDDLLHKHELNEAAINANGDWLQAVTKQALEYIRNKGAHFDILQRKLDSVTRQYEALVSLCRDYRIALQRAKDYFLFVQNCEEELNWLAEKLEFCQGLLQNRDISNVPQISRMYKMLENEMRAHWKTSKEIIAAGERLMQVPQSRDDIQSRISLLQNRCDQLRKISQALGEWLQDAEQICQYFQDANDAESWIKEKLPLARSDDYGRDLGTAEALISRHVRLEGEIRSYRAEVTRLDEMANQLAETHFSFDQAAGSVVTERRTEQIIVPKIKSLYPYEGNAMAVVKDEVMALVDKTNDEWWRVLQQDGTEGYVPANYCRIIENETVSVTQQVSTKVSKSQEGRAVLLDRQRVISHEYRRLKDLADNRHRLLSDAIKLFKFYGECDDFEAWSKETKSLLEERAPTEHLEAFRRKFDRLENDMQSIGGTQLKRINDMADELVNEGHSQQDNIRARQHRINQLWNDLQKLMRHKADALETAERINSFNENCESTMSWMNEKFELLKKTPGLSGLQALEMDLKPLEDKMRYLYELGSEIKKRHPEHAGEVDRMLAQLSALHRQLKDQARQKIGEAEQSQGTEMFDRAVRNLLDWLQRTTGKILSEPIDATSAEDLLQTHVQLRDEIAAKDYEITYVEDLGTRLLKKNPKLSSVTQKLQDVAASKKALEEAWNARYHEYQQLFDLQTFNREADRIDALTKGHEAFLAIANLGSSVENVENLLKTHADFESKLNAQDERLRVFSQTADKLIYAEHQHADYINKRRDEVLKRRQAVFSSAAARRAQLDEALIYQHFRRDAEELAVWIAEKKRIAADESFLDGVGLDRVLRKHQAFVAEVQANETQLKRVNKRGNELIARKHYESPRIQAILDDMNRAQQELMALVNRKSLKLGQAADRKDILRDIDDANTRLDDIEAQLAQANNGNDLRSVKELLQRKVNLDQEITILETRITEIRAKAEEIDGSGNYDRAAILASVEGLISRFNDLHRPVDDRRAMLEELLKWHQLAFDADVELHWIEEKRQIADSQIAPRSLTEATSMLKKHEQLINEVSGHESAVCQILSKGEQLIAAKHMSSPHIKAKCTELRDAWSGLQGAVASRSDTISWAQKREQYLFEASEVEAWIVEKTNLVHSKTDNVDENKAQKAATVLKALQKDMVVRKQAVEKLADMAKHLARYGDSALFEKRQDKLETDYVALEALIEQKRLEMDNYIALCNYNHESQDLELWVNEQLQTAMSEEYGQDYEHLQDLKAKFDEFQQNVRAGSDRFVQCEAMADELVLKAKPYSRDILKRQEKLRSVWTLLLEYIESREKKLSVADELHKFNRDVAEMTDRLREKKETMPTELGRDTHQVQNLCLRHEVFVTEVKQLYSQLQDLMDEGARLRAEYPGPNAEHITQQLAVLAELWEVLEKATNQRNDLLMASYDLQRFLAKARDFVSWTDIVNAELRSDNERSINDLQTAEWMRQENSRLKLEIDAREVEFAEILRKADLLVEHKNYARQEVVDRKRQVEVAYDNIKREWQLRDKYLYQVVQFHTFSRDVRQTIAAIGTRNATLDSFEIGSTVEGIESQIRNFDTFTKVLNTLSDRVAGLDDDGQALIVQQHMEVNRIEAHLKRVHAALEDCRSRHNTVYHNLQAALKHAHFADELVDLDAWIGDKLKLLRAEVEGQSNSMSISEKLDNLKRQQAFEIELNANQPRIDRIRNHVLQLKRGSGGSSTDLIQHATLVIAKWDELLSVSRQLALALDEARDLFDFNQAVERINSWMREKQLLLNANDMGNDLEHCQALLDRLTGKDADQSVDDSTHAAVNALGKKLIAHGSGSAEIIRNQLDDLNTAWEQLRGRIGAYNAKLEDAIAVHRFNRDADDTNTRIFEKAALMSSDDFGKDLAGVEALIRKQKTTERDMSAIHDKLKQHDQVAGQLLERNPPLRETIVRSLKTLEDSWTHLTELSFARRQRLEQAYNLHKYFDAVKKTEAWASGMRNKMTSYIRPKTVTDAEALIASHAERHAEIIGHEQELKKLSEYGQEIAAQQPDHKAEITRAHRRLQNIEHQIRQTWESENSALQKALKLQLLHAQVALTESWIASKEVVVNQYDPGDSIDAVDVLIKKHDAFEKTIVTQGKDKIEQLKADAPIFDETHEPDTETIQLRHQDVLMRYDALLENSRIKRSKLNDSRELHDFIRSCGELITWMSSRLQLAYDNDYLDLTNLRSKLQKHLASEVELAAHEHRFEEIKAAGEHLIATNHFERERVKMQLDEVVSGWNELKTMSSQKTRLLKESYEAYQLSLKLAQVDSWLDGVEHALISDDHGRDITSVEQLIKRHDELTAEIDAKKPDIDEAVDAVDRIRGSSYEKVDELIEQADKLQQRYNNLLEPCKVRSVNLANSLKFFHWSDEAAEQTDWLAELIPQLQSSDYGSSLHAVQSLSKKHAIVEQEISAREPAITHIKVQGYNMRNAKHFAATEIDEIVVQLRDSFDLVETLAKQRAARLAESLLSQQYYAEAGEASAWMRERLPKVSNQEVGNNQSSADAHLRRMVILNDEIQKFGEEVRRLRKTSEKLVASNHFDATHLTTTQAKLEELHQTLDLECQNRRTRLHNASQYYNFVRQVDDIMAWLKDKQRLSMRNDFGRDLQDCMQLIEEFKQVHRELSSAGERVHAIGRIQEDLLRNENPFASSIRALGSELEQLWRDVNDAANDRQQALLDAKNIHLFDQDADEMLNRLGMKEAQIVSLQNEDLTVIDLAMVKSFVETHEGFLRGLHIIEKQVADLCNEADRMIQQFPRTQEHLDVRRSELVEQLKDIQEEARKFQSRLFQAQNNQAYFQDYRDLMTWIRQMVSTITGEILPKDLAGCEALAVRHDEYKQEIDTREPQKAAFVLEGKKMVASGNALSNEIGYKITDLESGFKDLLEIWNSRKKIYDMNLDVQQWMHQAGVLEKWLVERESLLREDWRSADSVEAVEDMIRQYDDFLVTLEAQDPQFESLKRLTLVEQAFSQVKSREKEIVNRRESQVENRRDTQQIKTLEKKKILQEKRQERERRKTQEISIIKRTPSQETAPEFIATTLPRTRTRTSSADGTENVLVSTISQLPSSSQDLRESAVTLNRSTELLATAAVKAPGFTTRRSQSIKGQRPTMDKGAIDMHGFLERKNDLQRGGTRATFRSWKRYYTILCGQLMCFFKDFDSYMCNIADAPPIYIHNATCVTTTKKPNSFSLHTQDGAVYHFTTADILATKKDENQKMNYAKAIEWVEKVNFHAGLEPRNQLTSYRNSYTQDRNGVDAPMRQPPPRPEEFSRSSVVIERGQSVSTYDRRHPAAADTSPEARRTSEGAFGSGTLSYGNSELRASQQSVPNSSDGDDSDSTKKRRFPSFFKRGSKK